MAEPLKPSDPCYWMLSDPNIYSTPDPSVYNDKCYICRDPEYAQMGMSLCYACAACGGHVPADDVECINGHDNQELYYESLEKNDSGS
jgi:hypothetical protein